MSLATLTPQQEAQLQPAVAVDEDAVLQSIDIDGLGDDNIWQLEEMPNPDALDMFWNNVLRDVAQDPEWFSFAD